MDTKDTEPGDETMDAILTKTLKDGRKLELTIEVRNGINNENRPWPCLVAFADGSEITAGSIRRLRESGSGAAWVVGEKVGLTEDEGHRAAEALRAAERAQSQAIAVEIEAAVPGLAELRRAMVAHDRYDRSFAAMMEDEGNDGVRPPKSPESDVEDLARRYPRAALYLKAEGYELASHYAKSSAGVRAKKVLETGGSIEDAATILANWIPASSYTD